MVTDPAVGGMGDPAVNMADGLIFQKVPRIYQKEGQEGQVLGTQNRAAHLSRVRREQRHKWTGHKTFRRKSIPGNTPMNQKKGIRKRDPHPKKRKAIKLTRHATAMDFMVEFPGDGVVPRQRLGPRS